MHNTHAIFRVHTAFQTPKFKDFQRAFPASKLSVRDKTASQKSVPWGKQRTENTQQYC